MAEIEGEATPKKGPKLGRVSRLKQRIRKQDWRADTKKKTGQKLKAEVKY